MPYRNDQAHGRYPAHGNYAYPRGDDSYRDRPRDDGSTTLIAVIRLIVGIIVAIFALHVLFVVLGANQGNIFVSVDYLLAKTFVLGFGDVFTPHDAVLGVVLNYSLAALAYAVIGAVVTKALRRQ